MRMFYKMEENRRDTQAPEKRKPNLLVRLLAFLVTLALVLGAVALVVNRDRLNLDAVKRYFSYRDLERSDSRPRPSPSGWMAAIPAATPAWTAICSSASQRE